MIETRDQATPKNELIPPGTPLGERIAEAARAELHHARITERHFDRKRHDSKHHGNRIRVLDRGYFSAP